MEWLNYHHLLYFWLVVREGGLAPAGRELRLAQSTISGQIRLLEQSLGQELFDRGGRRLALTEAGHVVFRYAEEIFGLGRELQDTLHDRPVGSPLRLTAGIADVVPKLIARSLLMPALRIPGSVRLTCREGKPDRLLADLALHELDVVITDRPASTHVKVKAFNHLLGACGVALFASPDIAARLRRGFPQSLNGAPVLLPADNTMLRRSVDQWFDSNDIRPRIVAEFEDSALLNVFGQMGEGAFPAAASLEQEVHRQHNVRMIAPLPGVSEQFYAITVERRVKHLAVVAICEEARKTLS